MNVGHKLVRFIPAIWWGFLTTVGILAFNHTYESLPEHEQQLVAIPLFWVIAFFGIKFVMQSLQDAQDSIKETEAREDGLTTEYPGYGYLKSAHREIHTDA